MTKTSYSFKQMLNNRQVQQINYQGHWNFLDGHEWNLKENSVTFGASNSYPIWYI